MKICWDNLENVYLTIHGNFRYKDENGITLHERYHRSIRGKEADFREKL